MNNQGTFNLKATLFSCFKKVTIFSLILAILWSIIVVITDNTESISNVFWNVNNSVLLPIKYAIQSVIYYLIGLFIFMIVWLTCTFNQIPSKDYKNNLMITKSISFVTFLLLASFMFLYDKVYNETAEFWIGTLIFINVVVLIGTFISIGAIGIAEEEDYLKEIERKKKEQEKKDNAQQPDLFD